MVDLVNIFECKDLFGKKNWFFCYFFDVGVGEIIKSFVNLNEVLKFKLYVYFFLFSNWKKKKEKIL